MAGGAFSKFVKAQKGGGGAPPPPAAPAAKAPPFPPKKPAVPPPAAKPATTAAAPDPRKCPDCGKPIPKGEDSCPNCADDDADDAGTVDATAKPNPLMAWAQKNSAKAAKSAG